MSGLTVHPGHFTAGEKVLFFIDLEAGCVLELVWIFWRIVSCIASVKI